MKNAIFTIHIKRPDIPYELSVAYDLSLRLKKAYAQKCGAELIVADKKIYNWTLWESPERLRMYELFETYDRILYLDADVLIKPDAINIFELPEGNFYALNEICNTGQYKSLDREYMQSTFHYIKSRHKEWDNITHYLNMGVILADKKHREIFQYRKEDYFETIHMEQDYLNYNLWNYLIHNPGEKLLYLPIEWNGMILLVKEPDYLSRCNFIHYIGVESRGGRAKCMIQDYQEMIKRGWIKE